MINRAQVDVCNSWTGNCHLCANMTDMPYANWTNFEFPSGGIEGDQTVVNVHGVVACELEVFGKEIDERKNVPLFGLDYYKESFPREWLYDENDPSFE